MSSSSLSVPFQEVDNAQIIHLVAFGQGNTAHWALFVPNKPANPKGTLVHITIHNQRTSKSSSGVPELVSHDFKVTRSTANTVVALPARASVKEVKDAAATCFRNFHYNVFLDNCQTFTIQVLTELHRRCPSRVPEEAVRLIRERYATAPVKIQQLCCRDMRNEADGTHEYTAEKPRFPVE